MLAPRVHAILTWPARLDGRPAFVTTYAARVPMPVTSSTISMCRVKWKVMDTHVCACSSLKRNNPPA